MAKVDITTSPDASVAQQDLAMRNTSGVWTPQPMNGNSWSQNLPSGTYQFEHHIQGPNAASCGIVVDVSGATVKTIDKSQHVVAAALGTVGDDVIPFRVTVP